MGEKPKIFLKKSKKRDKSLYNKYVKKREKNSKNEIFFEKSKKIFGKVLTFRL